MINSSSKNQEDGNCISNHLQPIDMTSLNICLETKGNFINPQLEPFPAFYHLERTHKVIRSNISIQKIISNLHKCFQTLSIQAGYDKKRAGTVLITPEHIKIYLHFWKIGCDSDISVELQRCQGDTIIYHRYAKLILQAASGNLPENKSYNFCLHPIKKRIITISSDTVILKQLETASNLVKSDRVDAMILGMESLTILTDSRKTKSDVALYVSRVVVHEHPLHHDQKATFLRTIHNFVMETVQNRFSEEFEDRMSTLKDDDEYLEAENNDEMNPQTCLRIENILHNYGLRILSNALETLNYSNDKITDLMGDKKLSDLVLKTTQKDVLLSLLKEVDNAISRPHNACLAAKCLHLICTSSKVAHANLLKNVSTSAALLEIFMHAEEVGKATNLRLQKESEQLRQFLCDNQ